MDAKCPLSVSLSPSPSGSTARKLFLFSNVASWKCSSVFSMIQRCISLALTLLSLLKSTLREESSKQTWVRSLSTNTDHHSINSLSNIPHDARTCQALKAINVDISLLFEVKQGGFVKFRFSGQSHVAWNYAHNRIASSQVLLLWHFHYTTLYYNGLLALVTTYFTH